MMILFVINRKFPFHPISVIGSKSESKEKMKTNYHYLNRTEKKQSKIHVYEDFNFTKQKKTKKLRIIFGSIWLNLVS